MCFTWTMTTTTLNGVKYEHNSPLGNVALTLWLNYQGKVEEVPAVMDLDHHLFGFKTQDRVEWIFDDHIPDRALHEALCLVPGYFQSHFCVNLADAGCWLLEHVKICLPLASPGQYLDRYKILTPNWVCKHIRKFLCEETFLRIFTLFPPCTEAKISRGDTP